MKRFVLNRTVDETGISGDGIVAQGVRFADGKIVLRWKGPYSSLVVWENEEHMLAVHGHGGLTEIIWID